MPVFAVVNNWIRITASLEELAHKSVSSLQTRRSLRNCEEGMEFLKSVVNSCTSLNV